MALSIKHDEADRLARELAHLTGETLTTAVLNALRERIDRQRARGRAERLREELLTIGRRYSALPLRDARSAEDILGYDERGVAR